MGMRIVQRIYTCDECGATPDDGEHMWEMCGWKDVVGMAIICENCIDKEDEEQE